LDRLQGALDDAQRDARVDAHTSDRAEARAIVQAMLPVVADLERLNARLDALRIRLQSPSTLPIAFRPLVVSTAHWLQHATEFTRE
jgi:hypothetical protein